MKTAVEEGRNKPKVTPKRIKFQENLGEGEQDRISALPDCLLLEFLSRLSTTKDAIRTGTLSKRWKHIWTLVPSLIFVGGIRPWSDFVSLVDKTLTQCRQPKLKKFQVYCCYEIRFDSQLNNWIRYAITCDVEELYLTLWNTKMVSEFQLDQIFFISSCFTELILEGCVFNPIGEISWKNLRELCIISGKLDEDLIENILCGSPLLETLWLGVCYGYRRLDIASKTVKNLVFNGYFNPDDKFGAHVIRINAPNILSLTIRGELLLWNLLLQNVSSLVEANLDYRNSETTTKAMEEEMLKGFMLNLRHVKKLKVGAFCSKVLFRLEAKGLIFPSALKCPVIMSPSCSDNDSLEVGDSSDNDSLEAGDSSDSDSVETGDQGAKSNAVN